MPDQPIDPPSNSQNSYDDDQRVDLSKEAIEGIQPSDSDMYLQQRIQQLAAKPELSVEETEELLELSNTLVHRAEVGFEFMDTLLLSALFTSKWGKIADMAEEGLISPDQMKRCREVMSRVAAERLAPLEEAIARHEELKAKEEDAVALKKSSAAVFHVFIDFHGLERLLSTLPQSVLSSAPDELKPSLSETRARFKELASYVLELESPNKS